MDCYSGVVEAVAPWRFRLRHSGRTWVRLAGVVLDPVFCNVAIHRELAVGRGVDLFVHRHLFFRRCLVGVRRHDTGAVTVIRALQLAAWLYPLAILVLVLAFPGMLVGSVLSAIVCRPAGSCRDVVATTVVVAAMLVPVVSAAMLVRDVRAVRRRRRATVDPVRTSFPADL